MPLNPYTAGGGLSDPSGRGFYGREDIFEFVRSGLAVEQRGPILLYGQRRIGKSSILRQLPNHLPPDLVCVYFDLQGKASMDLDQVLFGLARAITERLKLPKPTREEATEETFLSQFLVRVIEVLGGLPQRLVLLFDEFDVVDEKLVDANVAARRFMAYLNDLASAQPQIGCILVVGRKTEELSAGFNAALLKNSIQHKIGLLDEKDCSRLIQDLANGYLSFDSEALRAIYAITAGHPFCTQSLCSAIWSCFVKEPANFPIPVTVACLSETVPMAIERGTAGLNWSFDGITNPTQRLFMSVMAGELPDPAAKPVSMAVIQSILRSRQIGVDQVELARAPKDLEHWNIIIKSDEGFRFAVPMIGLWIRKERPLEQLISEVRFSNPQAYQYYELASQAHKKGDLDQAISDYRGAINANPVFVEAFKGLAAAILERKGPAGLDEAIEVNERILEIDPGESPLPLLDLLSRRLDEPAPAEQQLKHFDRIGQLEPHGRIFSRARRQLSQMALSLMDRRAYLEAEQVFRKIDEKDMIQKAHSQGLRFRQARIFWGVCSGVPLTMLIVASFAFSQDNPLAHLGVSYLTLAVVGGASFSVLMANVKWDSKAIMVGAGPSTRAEQQNLEKPDEMKNQMALRSPGLALLPDPYAVVISAVVAAVLYALGKEVVWWKLAITFAFPAYVVLIRRDLANDRGKALAKTIISAQSKISTPSTSAGPESGSETKQTPP